MTYQPGNKRHLAKHILEIYRNSQYRTTTSGQKVRWDEPEEGDTPEVRKHNQDLKQRQQRTVAQDRLKSKSVVANKIGKPIIESPEALEENVLQVLTTFRQLYQSNRTTNFRTWVRVVIKVLEDLD